MFEFFSMMNNYEDRAVARFEEGDLCIDTCAVNDSEQPFETGIRHPAYNDGDWIIVQMYETKEDAEAGHEEWVRKMTAAKPPRVLKDVSTCSLKRLCETVDPEKSWISERAS